MNKEVYNEIDNDAVMDLALQAGHILLQSGAEISRVEETMQRICAHFGVRSEHVFVLTNGIFFTGCGDREHVFAKVEHIPVSGTRMDRIVEVNQLSRDIERGRYTVEAAVERLGQIRNMTEKRKMVRVLAAGAGSAGFCFMFGGDLADTACAFMAGFVSFISFSRTSLKDRQQYPRRGYCHSALHGSAEARHRSPYELYDHRIDYASGTWSGFHQCDS